MHAPRPLVAMILSLAATAHARTIARPSQQADPPPTTEPRPPDLERDATIEVALLGDNGANVHFSHAAVAARDTGDAGVVTLALTLATTDYAQAAYVDVELPVDARIVGLVFDRGGALMTAEPRPALEARRGFAEAVARRIDPVLLEVSEHGHAQLSIFPVSADEPVTARLQIAMDRVDRVTVDIDGRHVEATATPDATDDDLRIAALPSAIGEQQSLVVEPDGPPPTEAEIHHQFQLARGALRRCDEHRDEHADVAVHFKIRPDGAVTNIWTEYKYDDYFNDCLVNIVGAWHFAPTTEPTKVSYPIVFNRGSRAAVATASLE